MSRTYRRSRRCWALVSLSSRAAPICWGGRGGGRQAHGARLQGDQQLINRYAYGIDTCGENGYDYANVFTTDGEFIDKNSDSGYAAGGRVLAKGRDALAELVGGGSKGCKTKLPWRGWSHLMLNHEITATPKARRARLSRAARDARAGQRRPPRRLRGHLRAHAQRLAHQERTHVRNKAWYAPRWRSPDLN